MTAAQGSEYCDDAHTSGVRRIELPAACPGCSPTCERASECRAAASRPGRYGVLVTTRRNYWYIRAELAGGWGEVQCLCCGVVYERQLSTIVSGESTKCAACARSRKAG